MSGPLVKSDRDLRGINIAFSERVKQLREASALTTPKKEPLAEVSEAGVFMRKDKWPMSAPKKRPCEEYLENSSTGAMIVLTKDNLGRPDKGYGGKGATHCGAIDLVVGRNSATGRDGQEVNPMPFKDAARIYISQKTDCDANFGLVTGGTPHEKGTSAIVAKADSVRVVGKRSVKIVAGFANAEDSKNALGNPVVPKGIDLISWNKTDGSPSLSLQGIVKGDNLIHYIESLHKEIGTIMSILINLIGNQVTFNTMLSTHFHNSPYFMGPTTPSAVIKGAVPAFNSELASMAKEVLSAQTNMILKVEKDHIRKDSDHLIMSRYNRTN